MPPRYPHVNQSNQRLRSQAEFRLLSQAVHGQRRALPPTDKDVIHELQVTQVELDLQNEELRSAQVELEQSRDRYLALFEQAPVAYLTLDPSGRILEANRCATELLGPEIVGQRLSAYMESRDADAFHFYRQRVFAASSLLGCELALVSPGRRKFVAQLKSRCFFDWERSLTLCRTVVVDLERDGSTSELSGLVDNAADAIVTVNAAGAIQTVNPAAETMFGYKKAEIHGRAIAILLTSQVPHQTRMQSGEASGVRKDGTAFPVEIGAGEWWGEGHYRLTLVVRDVTARRQAEHWLRQSEERFRNIAEAIGDAVYVRERDGTLSYVSPAWKAIAQDPSLKPGVLGDIHPEDRLRIAPALESLNEGHAFDESYRLLRGDKSTVWVRHRAYVVRDADQTVVRHVGLVQDISAERA